MMFLKRRAICLLAAMGMGVASAGAALATGIELNNEMELDIKAVYCVNDAGETKQVTGVLKAESSVTVQPDKFPEYDCNRIAVQTANGGAWQFYHEPEPGAATKIVFSMDKANPNGKASFPSLQIESSGESYVSPAGVPLSFLAQAMQFGLSKAEWKKAAAPGADESKNSDEFAVSFADTSWSFAGNGLVFAELVPNIKFAESANLFSEFSNSTLRAIFDGMKAMGATPWGMTFKGNEAALTKEGKDVLPNAKLMTDTDTDAARWEAVHKFMKDVTGAAGQDLPRIVFGNNDIMFELVLDLDGSAATLTITRREDAAFG